MFSSLGGRDDDVPMPPGAAPAAPPPAAEADAESAAAPAKASPSGIVPFEYSRHHRFERLQPIRMETKGAEFGSATTTPLQLVEKDIQIEIVAGVAKTSVTMRFENTHHRTLEGELIFPLPKDTSVFGYALDVAGVLVDAVPVQKDVARAAFEEAVRTGGPAVSIAEKVDAHSNVFKTRVFPMHPGPENGRIVKVVTLVPLIPEAAEEEEEGEAGEGGENLNLRHEMLYWLSLDADEEQKTLRRLTVKLVGSDAEVFVLVGDELQACQPDGISLAMAAKGVLVKVPSEAETAIYTETDPDEVDDVTFFAASSALPVAVDVPEAVPIKKILIAYDVSHSRLTGCERQAEVDLLAKVLDSMNSPDAQVDILTFSNEVHEKASYPISDKSAISEFLMSQRCDGATNLPFEALQGASDTDLAILFTDGVANYGPDVEESLTVANFPMPIYSISSSSTTSYVLLRYLAEKTGGRFHDMTTDPEDAILEAVEKRLPIPTLRCVEYEPGTFSSIVGVIQQGRVLVYGKILSSDASALKLHLDGGRTVALTVHKNEETLLVPGSTIVRTLWAQKRIDRLSVFSEKNKKLIEAIGTQYGIVSAQTSLIVMSELQQYLKYKICPPKQLVEMRQAFLAQNRVAEQSEEDRVRSKIESVAAKWERRVKWHMKPWTDLEKEGHAEMLEGRRRDLEEMRQRREEKEQRRQEEIRQREEELRRLKEEMARKAAEEAKKLVDAQRSGPASAKKGEDEGEGKEEADEGKCDKKMKKKSRQMSEPEPEPEMMMECEDEDDDEDMCFGEAMDDCMEEEEEVCCAPPMEMEMERERCEEAAPVMEELCLRREAPQQLQQQQIQPSACAAPAPPPMSQPCSAPSAARCRSSAAPVNLMSSLSAGAPSPSFDVISSADISLSSVDISASCKKLPSKPIAPVVPKVVLPESREATITITTHPPDSDYLRTISGVYESTSDAKKAYEEYLNLKGDRNTPPFFLDCSDYFLTTKGLENYGVRILSTILDLGISDAQLFRIVGYRLDQGGRFKESIQVFEAAKKLKPEDPQSYRDVGLLYEKIEDYQTAAEHLWRVITGKWDGRFDEVELTAAVEMNHVLYNWKDEVAKARFIDSIDERFVYNMACDCRFSMSWDTDMTDIDLHVYDPDGNHCYYGNHDTPVGGYVGRDFTQGYGPEEFMQRVVLKSGIFRITAKFFSNHQSSLTGGTTILCGVFTNWCRPNEQGILATLRLSSRKEDIEVARVEYTCQ